MTPNVQIDGSAYDVIAGAVEAALLQVQLCGYGSQCPHIFNEFVYGNLMSQNVVADSNGGYHFALYSNDLIVPAGTYYTFTFMNANGDIQQVNAYRFIGAGQHDTSAIDPFDPNQPPPPLPPLIANQLLNLGIAGDNIVFPGDVYTAFYTMLAGDVTAATTQDMVPGNLYTFIIQQDGMGEHLFGWPSTCRNAALVNPQPNNMTIQTFVCDGSGNLYAIAGGTYWP